MYTVLNSGFQVKGSLTLNNGIGSTAFFADTITQQIATDDSNNPNTLLSNSFNDYDKQGNTKQWNHTLTLSVEATNLGTSITTSDYIMYFDEVAEKYYMMKVIDTATDRNSGFIKVDCINTAIYELGKQLVVEEKTFKNATLSQVVESVYKNAPFSVVIQDDLTISIDYTISANTSLQSVVQDLQTKYNVDVDSWITLDNDGQIGERVLYFGHLGSDNGELIRYGGGKGFENINAQELSDIIYTKVYITGVASDTDTKKGHIGSVNNGLEYIVDDDANQRIYTVGASQQQPVYLEGQLTNNILSEPSALLDWGKEQLALFNHPRFNYTVTPLHDEVVGIGDSITVQDFHIQPMILVTSKVIQKSTSFASPETNTFVLGEFSSIFSDRASKNNMFIEVIKKNVTVVQAAADIAKAQADEAHRQAILAQEQAIHAQTSADGKTTTYTVDSFQDLPDNAVEGDIGWVKLSDGTHMYSYTDGKWVEKINPSMGADISKEVSDAVTQAKSYTATAIEQNNASQQEVMSDVAKSQADLAIKDGDFNNKAQAMADKALSDAKANTVQVAQDALNSANQNLADAKKSLTDGIAQEASDRVSAVGALDIKAQGYADIAKKNAIDVATSADGTINKKIDDTASSITSTVSQNKMDAEGKITTAQSTATQALNGLSSKVDTATYNAKTGQLSTDVTNVTQTANQAKTDIASIKQTDTTQDARMTTIEADASGVKTTVSDLQTAQGKQSGYISTLQQRADGFDATVTKVDNLAIGGRNLLLGTRDWIDNTRWNQENTVTKDVYKGMFIASSGSAWASPAYMMQNAGILQVGKTYTFSTYVRNTSDTDTNVASYYDNGIVAFGAYTIPLPAHTDWMRVSKTFKVIKDPTTSTSGLRWEGQSALTNGQIQFAGYKLEEGNLPTDWTPAPEDVDSATAKAQLTADNASLAVTKLTNADGIITKAQADIKANADAITAKVSKTVYDQKTGDLTQAISKAQSTADGAVSTVGNYKTSNDGRVKAAESKIEQNSKDITARVSKTDYDNNNSQLNTRFTKVEATADGASTTVSKLQTAVNNLGQVNQLMNTEFNPDLEGWTLDVDKGSITPYSSYVAYGSRGIGFNTLNADANTYASLSQTVQLPSTRLSTDVMSLLWRVNTRRMDNYCHIWLVWQDANGVSLGQNTMGNWNDSTLDNYNVLKWENISIPIDAKQVDIRFETREGTNAYIFQPMVSFTNTIGTYVAGAYNNNAALAQVKITADGVSDIVSDPQKGLSVRVQTAEGTLNTVKSTADGAMSKANQTANDITQEISDRGTGDTNTLQSAKTFTQSSISGYDTGLQTQLTQTSSALLATVSASNLVLDSSLTDSAFSGSIVNWIPSGAGKWYYSPGVSYQGVQSMGYNQSSLNGNYSFVDSQPWGINSFSGSTLNVSVDVIANNIGGTSTDYLIVVLMEQDNNGNQTQRTDITGTISKTNNNWVNYRKKITINSNSKKFFIRYQMRGNGNVYVARPYVGVQELIPGGYTAGTNNNNQTILSLFKDNWSIGITDNIGAITSGIVGNSSSMSLISKNITLDGNTTVTGDFYAKGGNFQNLNASNIKVGTLDGYQVNIANVNVNNLVGDTITGFNFNVNKQMTIASGGIIQSDVIHMSKTSFSVSAPNVGVQRTSTEGYNVMVYGTFSVSSILGNISTIGTINVTKPGETKPYKTGNSYSEYGVNNLYIYTKNYSNGDPNEHLNIASAEIDIMQGGDSGMLSDSINSTRIRATSITTTGSVTSGNISLNGNHTIISQDGGRVFFNDGNDNRIDISVKTVSQSSLVSLKENIRDIDPAYALGEVLKSDVKQYNFIGESKDNIRVSPMIDDVNHELYIPKDWLAEDGKSVENYTITGYLIQSIKALQQEITELKQG